MENHAWKVFVKKSEVNVLIQERGINSRITTDVDLRIILKWIFKNWFGGT
jgi:hypothetical protein